MQLTSGAPQQFQEPPGRRRVASGGNRFGFPIFDCRFWIFAWALDLIQNPHSPIQNPHSPIQNHVEAGRKRPCSSAVRRLAVFVFSVIISRIRNALRRSFRLQD